MFLRALQWSSSRSCCVVAGFFLCWRLKTKGKENDGDVPWWAPCHVPACPLCFLLEDKDKDIETGKKKDELCTERGSILRNSSFSLQYFAIFVLKQSCIRQDEGEHTLNLSAEMEPWQEVCFSSSFCKFALARGTVLTCPGEWKPFLFLGKLRARKEGRAQVLVCLVLLKTANTWLIYFAKGVTTWKKRTPLGFSCKSCQVMNKQNSG